MSENPKKPDFKEKKKPEAHNGSTQARQNAAVVSDSCKAEDCKKKSSRFGFCDEHYEMYMAGVIRGDGSHPEDYQAKLAWYLSRHKRAVA